MRYLAGEALSSPETIQAAGQMSGSMPLPEAGDMKLWRPSKVALSATPAWLGEHDAEIKHGPIVTVALDLLKYFILRRQAKFKTCQ